VSTQPFTETIRRFHGLQLNAPHPLTAFQQHESKQHAEKTFS